MRNKILLFISGVILGIVLGVAFGVAIKALLNQFRKINIGILSLVNRQNAINQRLDSLQLKLSADKKMISSSPNSSSHTIAVKAQNQRTAPTPVVKASSADSNFNSGSDSDVVIMTNQLITVEYIPLVNKDSLPQNSEARREDSLLAAMSDVEEKKAVTAYRVEFWHSPLNFKGYKMTSGKLILYGINSTAKIKLVKCSDTIYLIAEQLAFRLEFTDDFKPFERVSDAGMLKKLST